jgi:hypothetical protein
VRWLKRLVGRAKSQTMGPSDFGPFESVWRDGPGHLPLLHMNSGDVPAVLGGISDALASADDSPRYVQLMLQDANWRPHLVAAIAALLSSGRSNYAPALWAAFDSGSWVAPQLACALYFLDPEFASEAKRRIAGLCPVAVPPGLSAAERHSATGSAGLSQRSAKNLASLMRVLARIPSETTWVASELDKPEVQELLESDVDSSAEIADSWFDALHSSFERLGRELRRLAV